MRSRSRPFFSLLAIALATGLGACGLELPVVSVSVDHVSIRYASSIRDADGEDVQAVASEQCAYYGRRAVFHRSTPLSWELSYAHYTCVE